MDKKCIIIHSILMLPCFLTRSVDNNRIVLVLHLSMKSQVTYPPIVIAFLSVKERQLFFSLSKKRVMVRIPIAKSHLSGGPAGEIGAEIQVTMIQI